MWRPQRSGTHLFCTHEHRICGRGRCQDSKPRMLRRHSGTCCLSRERGKCQRTENWQQKSGQANSLPGSHCRLDGHKAKNARKVQPHEKPIATQFKEEIRVMDGTDFRSLAVCSPRAHLGISLSAATYRYCTSTSPVPVQP